MNEHTQKALEWLQAVVTEAMDVWKQGDLLRLNQITENKAIAYYVNNVHGRPETVLSQWMHWYPGHIKEVERLYTNYLAEERASETADKLTVLEQKFEAFGATFETKLAEVLALLQEAKPPAAEPEPEKPARKKRAKKATVVTEEAAEPAAEPGPDDEDEEEEQEAPAETAAEEAPETETEDEADPTEAE